ncbi:MAG: hypothetical protein H6737_12265 [Alphaproteobacteria bacterium]|nr:hypothetical protein [Alphaproteobacteria bacterium]
MWLALLTRTAQAGCDAPYSVDDMVVDLSATEAALRDADHPSASAGAKRLEAGLPCLDSPLNATLSARVYRSMGAGLVAGDDIDTGTAWMRTAVEVDSSFVYGVDEMADGHPAWDAWNAAQGPVPAPKAVEGQQLTPGNWKLDGRNLDSPAATVDRPHILQRGSEDTWTSWRLDGNAFPADALEALQIAKVKPEKTHERRCRKGIRFKGFIASDGQYCAATPGEQIFFTVSGPVVLGAAGLMYLEGWRQYGLTRDASNLDEMLRHKRINNRVVAGSAALAGVGIGLGVFGISYTGQF